MICTTTRRIRAYLAGAVATNQPVFNSNWVDIDGINYVTTPDSAGGALNSTTPVEMVTVAATGFKRQVVSFTIHNLDTADVTAIMEVYDGATSRPLYRALLSPGWSLEWEHGGSWHVYDEEGVEQGTGGGGATGIAVEEVDGSPALTGITTIRFDQGDGFVVSSPGAGIARIDATGTPAPDEEARMLVFMALFNRGL